MFFFLYSRYIIIFLNVLLYKKYIYIHSMKIFKNKYCKSNEIFKEITFLEILHTQILLPFEVKLIINETSAKIILKKRKHYLHFYKKKKDYYRKLTSFTTSLHEANIPVSSAVLSISDFCKIAAT